MSLESTRSKSPSKKTKSSIHQYYTFCVALQEKLFMFFCFEFAGGIHQSNELTRKEPIEQPDQSLER